MTYSNLVSMQNGDMGELNLTHKVEKVDSDSDEPSPSLSELSPSERRSRSLSPSRKIIDKPKSVASPCRDRRSLSPEQASTWRRIVRKGNQVSNGSHTDDSDNGKYYNVTNSPVRLKHFASTIPEEGADEDLQNHIPVAESLSYDDSDGENDNESIGEEVGEESPEVKLTTIVWKRKSGFSSKLKSGYSKALHAPSTLGSKISKLGKKEGEHPRPSTTNVKWERRRIVLDGRNIMYYDENVEIHENEEDKVSSEDHLHENDKSSPSPKHFQLASRLVRKLSEKMDSKTESAVNTPRGVMDAASANIVVATIKHAPTPFTLTIGSGSRADSKWDLCFENRKEFDIWQNSLLDVSLEHSSELFKKTRGDYYIDNSSEKNKGGTKNIKIEGKDNSEMEKEEKDRKNDQEQSKDEVKKLYSSRVLSTPSQVVTRHDLRIVVSTINISLLYLWYCAKRGEVTFFSYVYVSFVVNGAIYMLLCQNDQEHSINQYTLTEKQNSENLNNNKKKSLTIEDFNQSKHKDKHQDKRRSAEETSAALVPRSKIKQKANIQTETELNRSTYKPLAGKSSIKLLNPDASNLNIDGIPMVGWYPSPPQNTLTRGTDYLTTKKKIPCPGSLYELVKVDVFKSRTHFLEVSKQFDLSELSSSYEHDPPKTWNAPDIFVISFALPTSTPKLGRTHTDKKGYITTGYYRMREDTRKILSIVSRSDYDPSQHDKEIEQLGATSKQIINGVKLWEEWCCRAPSDEAWLARLKFIAKGDNLREVGGPKWICNYNGKPILIKRAGVTGFVFSYDNVMEYDLSLHPFPYLFKSGMSYLKDHLFPKMLMTFSFVIEGRSENELPEIMIGNGLQLCYVQDKFVLPAEDVFGGSSPNSS